MEAKCGLTHINWERGGRMSALVRVRVRMGAVRRSGNHVRPAAVTMTADGIR